MLRAETVNQQCYSCHADKRGPYVFAHPLGRGELPVVPQPARLGLRQPAEREGAESVPGLPRRAAPPGHHLWRRRGVHVHAGRHPGSQEFGVLRQAAGNVQHVGQHAVHRARVPQLPQPDPRLERAGQTAASSSSADARRRRHEEESAFGSHLRAVRRRARRSRSPTTRCASTGQVTAGGIVTDANSKDPSKFEQYQDLSNGMLSNIGIFGRNQQELDRRLRRELRPRRHVHQHARRACTTSSGRARTRTGCRTTSCSTA